MTQTTSTIELGNGLTALVDSDDLAWLNFYKWRAVKRRRSWYARADADLFNNKKSISMSRLIARTMPDEVCHHRDRNSLNNTKQNLLSLSKAEHKKLHKDNRLLVKFST